MRPVEISVIEDSPADVRWLKTILSEVGLKRLKHRLTVAEDGEQAVECLLREGRYAGNPSADLIFLDMHLPMFDGLEVLRKVPGSALLPVCILTQLRTRARTYGRAFRETDGVSDQAFIR